jgi:type VI secretion system secreted protein Hcp
MTNMAVDFFLKLDGINGEATDQNHTNELGVLSWSWGASQHSSVSNSSGSGAGKASLSDFSIMKNYDAASVPLLKSLMAGTHIANGVLTANKSGSADGGKPFLKVTFTELFVTSIQASGSSEVPTESVSFSYGTIKVEYSKQNDQGVLATAGQLTYDLKQNKLA